eukprot:UN34705
MPTNKFAAAILIAFDVSQKFFELGLTQIFFKPAKAQVLDDIMQKADKLSDEQIQRVLSWLAQDRVRQLMGSLKTYVHYSNLVRDNRAKEKWNKVGRLAGLVEKGLMNWLHHAKRHLKQRKENEALIRITAFHAAVKANAAQTKQINKTKKACKLLKRALDGYNVKKGFMSWLGDAVERTRVRKEKERLEREKREKEERERQARLKKIAEEKKRKEEEERLAKEKAEREKKQALQTALNAIMRSVGSQRA